MRLRRYEAVSSALGRARLYELHGDGLVADGPETEILVAVDFRQWKLSIHLAF